MSTNSLTYIHGSAASLALAMIEDDGPDRAGAVVAAMDDAEVRTHLVAALAMMARIVEAEAEHDQPVALAYLSHTVARGIAQE